MSRGCQRFANSMVGKNRSVLIVLRVVLRDDEANWHYERKYLTNINLVILFLLPLLKSSYHMFDFLKFIILLFLSGCPILLYRQLKEVTASKNFWIYGWPDIFVHARWLIMHADVPLHFLWLSLLRLPLALCNYRIFQFLCVDNSLIQKYHFSHLSDLFANLPLMFSSLILLTLKFWIF